MSEMLDAALAYAERGWPVFPCEPSGKAPAGRLVPNGLTNATTDLALLQRWWHALPEANVAVATGSCSIDVLDVDVRPNGSGWHALARAGDAGLLAGALSVVTTPSTGLHLHYPGTAQRSSKIVGQHLDFKADGGYVLMPPSYVVNAEAGYAGTYHWAERRAQAQRPSVAPLDWAAVAALLAPPRLLRPWTPPRSATDIASLVRWMAGQQEGNRNHALFWAACTAVENGCADLAPLADAARAAGLSDREIHGTITSAQQRIRDKASMMLLDELDAAAERLQHRDGPPVDHEPTAFLPVRRFADLAADVDARGPRQWLIRGIWPAGDYGVHAADPKAGKTWNAHDLAVSVASGTPWLGAHPIDFTGPVIVFAGEGGEGNVVRRLRAIAAARGLRADELDLYVCARAPHLNSDAHMMELQRWVQQVRPALVVLDPFYLAARGAKAGDLYSMGGLLERPQHICQDAGAALFVVHHFNRQRDAVGAARMTGAGPAEWGRVLISATVVSRHEDKATRGTTVLTELSVIGGEVPDQTFRLRRRIHADDPDNLDSRLHYNLDAVDADEGGDDVRPDMHPAQAKLLEAAQALARPANVRDLVDAIAARHGHGLTRQTCSTNLNKLLDAGLVDVIDQGAGRERLWLATGSS